MNRFRVAAVACIVVASLTGCTTPTHHTPIGATDTVYAGVHLPRAIAQDIDATGVLAPCPREDSTDCYWDAVSRGNNQGVSFIAWKGTYYYAR